MNGNLQNLWGLSLCPPYPTPVHISSHVAYSSTAARSPENSVNYPPDWLHIITFNNSEIFNLNRGINMYVVKRNFWITNPYRCNQIKQKDLPHPGLSYSLHPTWPTSSEMLRARHSIFLLVSGSYISISLWMWYTCNSFAISSVTYRDSGIITWNTHMIVNLSCPFQEMWQITHNLQLPKCPLNGLSHYAFTACQSDIFKLFNSS